MLKPFKYLFLSASCAALLAAGCSSDIIARGNLPKAERLAQVQPGVSKDDVLQAIGSPTSTGTFNDRVWYYVGQRTEEYAFNRPKVIERVVLAISFDDSGRVAEVKHLDQTASRDIEMVQRTTPGVDRDLNLWQQLFSNLGKNPAMPGMTGGSGGSGSGL